MFTLADCDPSAGAPSALALATVSVPEAPDAPNSTVPGVAKLLPVVARTEWSATPSASAAPTEVFVPRASPSARVATGAEVSVAFATRLPLIPSVTPTPTDASVLKFENVIATTGVTAVPPAAPPSAVVATLRVLVASSVTLRAVTLEPFPSCARVWSSTMCTATEAPMPVFAPVVASAAAPDEAELSSAELAANRRSVAGALTVFPESTDAEGFTPTTLTDNAPAKPTLDAAPAPEVADVPNVVVSGFSARTTTALAPSTVSPSLAVVATLARLTAMATPTPEAVESTGPPSASADECALDRAFTLCSPPVVVTWTAPAVPATYASVAESRRLNERAPAYWRSP